MDFAGARQRAARFAASLRRARPGAGRRGLAADLARAVHARPCPPADVRELCLALCEAMGERRAGRPVELRFERFPDEIEVTGLWMEFQEFDLLIVEERAEAQQQLVILGHELWHMHAGHRHHHGVGAAHVHALAGRDDIALTIAARNGSRKADEAEADDFGHRLAASFRPLLSGRAEVDAAAGADSKAGVRLDPVWRSMGYRGGSGR